MGQKNRRTTTNRGGGVIIYIYVSPSQPVAEGLIRASEHWSIHVLSLSLHFSSSITQACAQAILIIITSLHAQAAVMKIKHSLTLIHQD